MRTRAASEARLDALKSYQILDTPPEERFDRITRHAAFAFGLPISLITFVDGRRPWFKSCYGLSGELTPPDVSFCDYTVREDRVLVVEDAAADERFASNPLVSGSPGIRFYAGAPLRISGGHRVGALCVLDTQPRSFPAHLQTALYDLAGVVEQELEHSRRAVEAREQAERVQRLESRFQHMIQNGSDLITLLDDAGTIRYQSPSVTRVLGHDPDALVGKNMLELLHPDDAGAALDALGQFVKTGENDRVALRVRTHDGKWAWLEALGTNLLECPSVGAVIVNSRDVTDRKRQEALQAENQRILEQIARRAPLADVLSSICTLVEGNIDGGVCSILLLEGTQLRHGAAPGLPPEFCEATDGIEVGPEVGTCGAAAHLRETVIASDIATDPNWRAYRGLALAHDLRTCFSTPIFAADGAVLGTFAIYYRRPQQPPAEHRKLVQTATHLAGIALENRRSERALRESETRARRLAAVADRTTNAVIITDNDNRIEWVNEGFTRLFGYTFEEVVGQMPTDLLGGPETGALVRHHISSRLAARQSVALEIANYHRDGRRLWVSVDIQPLYDLDGRPAGFMSLSSDITERRKAEARVRESEGRYRALSALVSTFAFSYRVDEDGTATLEWLTDSIEEVMGFSTGELIGGVWGSGVDEEQQAEAAEALRQVLDGTPVTYELPMPCKDGRRRWFRVVMQPEWDVAAGRVARIYGAGQDITDQKRHEQELVEARDRAEEMSRLKDAFLANMSHELRTPLTSIIGFSGLLAEEVDGEVKELAEMIYRSGERLKDTLGSVLDLAQLESGSLRLHPARTNLAVLAQEATDLFQREAREKGLSLSFEPGGGAAWADLDRGAVVRILNNLLSNALKFTRHGSVTVSAGQTGAHAWLRVEDTGVGISEAFLPHLFDDFMQESSGLARDYEGTGLGLPITRRLVELMGGEIVVKSVQGKGSTFVVTFPVAPSSD